jgi:enhancing lycopene biosynthesis protein 2
VDVPNKIVSTPAFMLAKDALDAEAGINKLVEKVLSMAS